jgi:dGTPase
MDWADDTAYSINDLADGIKAEFITEPKLTSWKEEKQLDAEETAIVDKVLEIMRSGNVEKQMSLKIGEFVHACSVVLRHNFMSDVTNRYRYGMEVSPSIRRECELYKRIAVDLIFKIPQVNQLDYKSNLMLKRMFTAFYEAYVFPGGGKLLLLPRDLDRTLRNKALPPDDKARHICDYLAGMTDVYASRVYRRLFDPEFGSLVDLI